jgi:hypothetical protein
MLSLRGIDSRCSYYFFKGLRSLYYNVYWYSRFSRFYGGSLYYGYVVYYGGSFYFICLGDNFFFGSNFFLGRVEGVDIRGYSFEVFSYYDRVDTLFSDGYDYSYRVPLGFRDYDFGLYLDFIDWSRGLFYIDLSDVEVSRLIDFFRGYFNRDRDLFVGSIVKLKLEGGGLRFKVGSREDLLSDCGLGGRYIYYVSGYLLYRGFLYCRGMGGLRLSIDGRGHIVVRSVAGFRYYVLDCYEIWDFGGV